MIYLDHHATSPLRPEAKAAMAEAMDVVGNPSSIHGAGRKARALLEGARERIAAHLNTRASAIVFTSGGTEANAHALGVAPTRLVSAIEHPAILNAGIPVNTIAVDGDGLVLLPALDQQLLEPAPEQTTLVSVMAANNETGAFQPLEHVIAAAKVKGCLTHSDAIQVMGKQGIDFAASGLDLASINAHKIGGPVGIGALVVRPGVEIAPFIAGGGQERGRRGGTENIVGAVGFAAALDAAVSEQATTSEKWAAWQQKLEARLIDAQADCVVFSQKTRRLPTVSCFAVPNKPAQTLLMALDLAGVAVSSGSACSSGKVAESHVLKAMGVDPALAQCAIRVSWGWNTGEQDLEQFFEAWVKAVG